MVSPSLEAMFSEVKNRPQQQSDRQVEGSGIGSNEIIAAQPQAGHDSTRVARTGSCSVTDRRAKLDWEFCWHLSRGIR